MLMFTTVYWRLGNGAMEHWRNGAPMPQRSNAPTPQRFNTFFEIHLKCKVYSSKLPKISLTAMCFDL